MMCVESQFKHVVVGMQKANTTNRALRFVHATVSPQALSLLPNNSVYGESQFPSAM